MLYTYINIYIGQQMYLINIMMYNQQINQLYINSKQQPTRSELDNNQAGKNHPVWKKLEDVWKEDRGSGTSTLHSMHLICFTYTYTYNYYVYIFHIRGRILQVSSDLCNPLTRRRRY